MPSARMPHGMSPYINSSTLISPRPGATAMYENMPQTPS